LRILKLGASLQPGYCWSSTGKQWTATSSCSDSYVAVAQSRQEPLGRDSLDLLASAQQARNRSGSDRLTADSAAPTFVRGCRRPGSWPGPCGTGQSCASGALGLGRLGAWKDAGRGVSDAARNNADGLRTWGPDDRGETCSGSLAAKTSSLEATVIRSQILTTGTACSRGRQAAA
jgi:hypothetical protein